MFCTFPRGELAFCDTLYHALYMADLHSPLGSFPLTYSPGSERWTSRGISVELDGMEWGISLSLEDSKLNVYAFNNDGANVHSKVAYAPTVTLGSALRSMLRAS